MNLVIRSYSPSHEGHVYFYGSASAELVKEVITRVTKAMAKRANVVKSSAILNEIQAGLSINHDEKLVTISFSDQDFQSLIYHNNPGSKSQVHPLFLTTLEKVSDFLGKAQIMQAW